MVSLEVSLVGFFFAVTVDCRGSVPGELYLKEISRLFSFSSLFLLVTMEESCLLRCLSFSIFSSVSFSLWLGSVELELSGGSLPNRRRLSFPGFIFWRFLVVWYFGDW